MKCRTLNCALPAIDHGRCAFHGRAPETIAREGWFCECPTPNLDAIGECADCHRKPRELMKVSG